VLAERVDPSLLEIADVIPAVTHDFFATVFLSQSQNKK